MDVLHMQAATLETNVFIDTSTPQAAILSSCIDLLPSMGANSMHP